MSSTEMQSVIRIFWIFILAILLLFGGTLLSSFLGSFGGGLSDEAYGLEELSQQNFTLPDDPVMTVWVWEKDITEKRELVTLEPRTPVRTGPSVAWSGGEGFDFMNPRGMNGFTMTVVGDGTITVTWEHDCCDCGFTHTWWYSPDPELTGGVDTSRLSRSHNAPVSGVNNLCILWQGEGGRPADTVTYDGNIAPDAYHHVTPLVQLWGRDEAGLNDSVSQDSMSILIRIENRNLLGRLTATATVRLTMVSHWRGAGTHWSRVREDVIRAENAGRAGDPEALKWLDLAIEPPTWTAELIGYTQAE